MGNYQGGADDPEKYTGYRSNISLFVQEILSKAVIDDSDYVPGTRRLDFYEQLIENASGFQIYDYKRSSKSISPGPYEEELYQRVISPLAGLLVLIGGLGSGKSTAIRHLCATIVERRHEIINVYQCACKPCVRRPIIIDCLDLDRTFTSNQCEAEVLMRIRREIYNQLINEWYLQNDEDPGQLKNEERKVLRRLLIANDVYRWADSEAIEFPAMLHTSDLDLDLDLLTFAPKDWNISSLVRERARAANALDGAIQEAIANVGVGKRFTALLIGFWLRSCNPMSPNNLIVVDNLDQQPTDNIEQITNHLHDLDARHRGLRILLPLRPSSIVPTGFTKNTDYMYHYGPDCFEIIYSRLYKNVLSRPRIELAEFGQGRPFNITSPLPEEVACLLVVTYIYSLICVNGMRNAAVGDDDDVRPNVHEDHEFLHRIQFGGAAIQQLADTLEAVMGTCGRYAMDQLRRYFDHVYSYETFLKQIETAGLSKGASAKIGLPFGQVISAVLGAHNADASSTGLANLYSATQVRTNLKFPTLSKLRVLSFLAIRGRVRVRDVVAALAHHGIPQEIAVEALNYLHAKNRLLLWFSRNTDLPKDSPDLDQYVVISEHGQSYLKDLAGDFEYVWFCAQQILATATSDYTRNFRTRLSDYRQLLTDFSRTEWKQMTFKRCSSATVWNLSTEVEGDEMLTLFLLYSSLERALRSAAVAVSSATVASRRSEERQYVSDIVDLVQALIDLILERQVDYEIYYGNNGYRKIYARKIEKNKQAVEKIRKEILFAPVAEKLDLLLQVWSLPIADNTHSEASNKLLLINDEEFRDNIWLEFVKSLSSSMERPEEIHAQASVYAILGSLVRRREALCRMLARRFPAYSKIDHELALLIEETKAARDAAEHLAAYAKPLLEWLSKTLENLKNSHDALKENAFSVPGIISMEDMDDLKRRANNISMAYAALASRLGANSAHHLEVRWSI